MRIIPAAELYADVDEEQTVTPVEEGTRENGKEGGGVEYDVVGQDGEVVMRTNRRIIDDPKSQIMSMDDIEAMKAKGISGKDMVAKILESHSALDQKTAFALAKYTLRKRKKYFKRFTVLPLDVYTLAQWIFRDKYASKIMDLRTEILALIGSWSNIHYTPTPLMATEITAPDATLGGRWLVVDETAGLLTAYMAERLGMLSYPPPKASQTEEQDSSKPFRQEGGSLIDGDLAHEDQEIPETSKSTKSSHQNTRHPPPVSTNTIHVIHSASQPNLSLLQYFHFDPYNPTPSHPLTTHLKILSWLQLLEPSEDGGYTEPEKLSQEELQSLRSGKRSNYYRKRRRWERIKATVDETRAGGFDGLIVASVMQLNTILEPLVPLLRGGAQVVVYAPTIEPLTELADIYSTARRSAFLSDPSNAADMPTEDFPLDPTLLLAPTIQTARARSWQVLPERTHPLMTGKGGSDGFVFTATRVLPAEGKIAARGKTKRRKMSADLGDIMVSEERSNTADGRLKGHDAGLQALG